MAWSIDGERLSALDNGSPRYELVAKVVADAIASGQLRANERLPTVRKLAQNLGVSVTTIAAAYNLLSQRGHVRSEVGRGTFVNDPQSNARPDFRAFRPAPDTNPDQSVAARLTKIRPSAWRRRTLITTAARLRAAYPSAADCSTGRPDPALLPWDVLQRAWQTALQATGYADLQYAGPEPVDALARELLPRLAADGVPARETDLVVGSSAQQFMVLAMQIAAALSDQAETTIAVEEPGYPTIFDTYEGAGYRLTGVEVDAFGAVPPSLDAALKAGASAVLLTPRAHNPTGASWSVERKNVLAEVLADHPRAVVIEDDHFAGAATVHPGSLLADSRIEDRVIYIRSFSKTMGPDLRLAVAVARPRLRALIADAKSFADGWSSRLAQRALAHALADRKLDEFLADACRTYAERRAKAAGVLHERLSPVGGRVWGGADGVNIWVQLPPDVNATQVIEQAAARGVLAASGEPFFIRPGHGDAIRLNAGAVSTERAFRAGEVIAAVALTTVGTAATVIAV